MHIFTLEAEVVRHRGGRPYREAKEIIIHLPEVITELTLRSWADFDAVRERAPELFADGTDISDTAALDLPPGKFQDFIAYALEAIYALAINREDLNKNDLRGLLPIGKAATADQVDGLMSMLAWALQPVRDYEPSERTEFDHGGHTYLLYTDYLDQFGNQTVGRELRTAEAVDALQFEQVFFHKKPDGQYLVKDGPYKNDLALISMLTRRALPRGEMELPPLDQASRSEWLENRMVDLAGVSLDVALDIGFFLQNSKSVLPTTRLSEWLGKIRSRPEQPPKAGRESYRRTFSVAGDGT